MQQNIISNAISFSEYITKLRLEKGWNGAELSRRSGVSQGSISRIERGVQSNITATTRSRLLAALGVPSTEMEIAREEPSGGTKGINGLLRGIDSETLILLGKAKEVLGSNSPLAESLRWQINRAHADIAEPSRIDKLEEELRVLKKLVERLSHHPN